jgi:hypothetical protein
MRQHLSVRVNHILGFYTAEEGRKKLEKDVPDLFEFLKEKVINDCN